MIVTTKIDHVFNDCSLPITVGLWLFAVGLWLFAGGLG